MLLPAGNSLCHASTSAEAFMHASSHSAEPFYAQLWFLITYILALAACLYFVVQSVLIRKHRRLDQDQAVEKERSRIAADMHDEIGAELTNIAILSQLLRNTAAHQGDESQRVIRKIEASSQLVITKMNEVIWTLDTKNQTLQQLMVYVRNYAGTLCEAQTSLRIHIDDTTRINPPLPAALTRNMFLIIKELLSNAIKHSKASSASISIGLSDLYTLHIEYCDNGIGFEPREQVRGNGLKNIRRRVSESGGNFTVQSRSGHGCMVFIWFPHTILKQ